MGKRRKSRTGWQHPKTGEWWSSKKGYHQYWEKYIKPKSKKRKEIEEASSLEDSFIDSEEYWKNYGYWSKREN